MEQPIKFSGGSITLLAQSELSLNEVLTLLNVVMGLMVEYIQTVKQLTGGGKEKTKKEKKAAKAANAAADAAADAKVKDLLEKVLAETSPEGPDNENIRETLNETIENYSEAINNDETPYRSSTQSWATFFLKSFKGNTLLLLFIAFSFIQPSEGLPFLLLPAILTGLQGAMYTGVILSEFAFFDYLIKEQQVALEAKQLSQAIDNNLINISDCAQTILRDVPPSFVSLSGQPLINATQFLGTEVYAPPSLSDVNVSELINAPNSIETFSVQINKAPSIKEQFSNATIGFNALAQSNLIFSNNVSTPQMCLVLNESTNTSTVAFIMKDHSDFGNIGLFLPETLTVNSSGTVDFNASTNATEKLWPQKVGQGAFQIIFNSSNTKTTVSTKILTELFVPIVYLTAPTDSTVGHRRTMITETPVATETSVRLQAQGPPAQLVLSGITDVGQSLITVEAPFSKKGTRTSGTQSASSSSFNPNLKIYTLLLSSLAAGVAAGAAAVSKRHQEISQENITRFVANNLDVVADVEQQSKNNLAFKKKLSELPESQQNAAVVGIIAIGSIFNLPTSDIFSKFINAKRKQSNIFDFLYKTFFVCLEINVDLHAPLFAKKLKKEVRTEKESYLFLIFSASSTCKIEIETYLQQLEEKYKNFVKLHGDKNLSIQAETFIEFLNTCELFKKKEQQLFLDQANTTRSEINKRQTSNFSNSSPVLPKIVPSISLQQGTNSPLMISHASTSSDRSPPTDLSSPPPKITHTKKLADWANVSRAASVPQQIANQEAAEKARLSDEKALEQLSAEWKINEQLQANKKGRIATAHPVRQTKKLKNKKNSPSSPKQTKSKRQNNPLDFSAEKKKREERLLRDKKNENIKKEKKEKEKKEKQQRPLSIRRATTKNFDPAEQWAETRAASRPRTTNLTQQVAEPLDASKKASSTILTDPRAASGQQQTLAGQTPSQPAPAQPVAKSRNISGATETPPRAASGQQQTLAAQTPPPAAAESTTFEWPQSSRNVNISSPQKVLELTSAELKLPRPPSFLLNTPEHEKNPIERPTPKKTANTVLFDYLNFNPQALIKADASYIQQDLENRRKNLNVQKDEETYIYVSRYITETFPKLRENLDRLFPTRTAQGGKQEDYKKNVTNKAEIYKLIVFAANKCSQPIHYILQAIESNLHLESKTSAKEDRKWTKKQFYVILQDTVQECAQVGNKKIQSKLMHLRTNAEQIFKSNPFFETQEDYITALVKKDLAKSNTNNLNYISEYITQSHKKIRSIIDHLYPTKGTSIQQGALTPNTLNKTKLYHKILKAAEQCDQPIDLILYEIELQLDTLFPGKDATTFTIEEFHICVENALHNCFRLKGKKIAGQAWELAREQNLGVQTTQMPANIVPPSQNIAPAPVQSHKQSKEIEDWQLNLTLINSLVDQGDYDEKKYWLNVSNLSTQQDIDEFKHVVVEKKGVNNISFLNKYPIYIKYNNKNFKSPYWQKKDNAGDGHCFYHAVLRFIYIQAIKNQQDVFWQAAKNDYVPKDYSLFNQSPKDVAALRLANFNHLLEMVKNTDDEKNETEYQSYKMAIRTALQNKHVDSYGHAGMGIWGEKEFESIAQLLQICMVFWQYVEKRQQGKYFAQAFIPNVPEEHASDKNLNQSCPNGIMYVVNSKNDHFENIFPVVPKLITGGRRRICTKRAGLKRAKPTRRTRRSLGQRSSLSKRRSSGGQRKKSRILKKRRGALKVTRRR